MNHRRLVGIDLGIASAHTVRVFDGEGRTVAKRKAWPTRESLAEVETAALAGCPPDTRLEVVIEPTGPAWLPIAVFFTGRGHVVHRVSSAKAADLRRFLSRHAKSNGIDAETLARLPLFDPNGLRSLELPGAERAALDRRVRATDRLTRAGAEHKRRIKDLVRQLLPMTPLTGDLGVADLAVLERWADPRALVKAGMKRLGTVIAKASQGRQGRDRAQQWLEAAEASLALYDDSPAVAFADLAAEVATEVRLLRAVQAELAAHASEREDCYRWVDPGSLARSLPGLAEVGGPALVACMGDPARFHRAGQFRSFTGLTPRASETGETDRKGQPMSKAGSSLLRTTLVRAANTARMQDPQLARIYYMQMVERGKGHLGAVCVVAAALAERAWAVLRRGMSYVVCDTDGRPVSPDEAKAIIAQHWTVPADVRARRRSKKVGKAPQQVLTAHGKPSARGAGRRGDLPRSASSTAFADAVNPRPASHPLPHRESALGRSEGPSLRCDPFFRSRHRSGVEHRSKRGGTMAVFNGAFPILPGKTDQARRFADEVMGARRREFDESQARFGATRETWSLQSTPDGDFVLVWFEAPDIEKGFATLGESQEPFDVWFREQVKEINGVDLAEPPAEAPPEVLVDWTK